MKCIKVIYFIYATSHKERGTKYYEWIVGRNDYRV